MQFEPLTANSPLLLLVIARPSTGAPPMLLSVTAWGELDVPTVVAGIVTLAGYRELAHRRGRGGRAGSGERDGEVLPPPVNVYVALSVPTAVGE